MTLCPIALDVDPLVGSPFPLASLDFIKQHIAIDYTDQDNLIEAYWFAAIEAFEGTTHRTVVQRGHQWTLAGFPYANYQGLWLPRGRTTAIASVAYVSGGTTTTLTGPTSDPVGTGYQEALFDHGALLLPVAGQAWPTVDNNVPEPVKITFTAGWTEGELPKDVLNALLFYTRNSFDDNRTDPQKSEANNRVFESMVSGWRLNRFY